MVVHLGESSGCQTFMLLAVRVEDRLKHRSPTGSISPKSLGLTIERRKHVDSPLLSWSGAGRRGPDGRQRDPARRARPDQPADGVWRPEAAGLRDDRPPV